MELEMKFTETKAAQIHNDNTITTTNLRLRPLEEKDVEEVFHLSSWNSQDCFCTLPQDRRQCDAWIEERVDGNHHVAYCVELFPKHPKPVVIARSIKQKHCYVISLIGVH